MAEGYCWATTQEASLSCCGRLESIVLESGFQLDCLVDTRWILLTIRILISEMRKIRLEPEFRNIDYCVIRELLVILKQTFCMH